MNSPERFNYDRYSAVRQRKAQNVGLCLRCDLSLLCATLPRRRDAREYFFEAYMKDTGTEAGPAILHTERRMLCEKKAVITADITYGEDER